MPSLRILGLAALCSAVFSCRTAPQESALQSRIEVDTVPLNLSEEMDPRNCKVWSETINDSMSAAYSPIFGHRETRFWYYLYFAVRNSWPNLSARDQEWLASASPHWQIPTNVIPKSSKSKNQDTDSSNLAGEDFLFVHHGLVIDMRDILAEAGQPCISSWPTLPDPRSTATPDEGALAKDYPVPAAGSNPLKDDVGLAAMKSWEKKLKNRTYLKTISLNQLGEILEAQIFRPTMLRFTATESKSGVRPRILAKDDVFNTNWAWNQTDYDLLSDTYSALVNPVFWKVQGELDSFVFRWLKANGFKEIAADCETRAGCYQWKTSWVGAKPNLRKLSGSSLPDGKKLTQEQGSPLSEAPELLKTFHKSSRFNYIP